MKAITAGRVAAAALLVAGAALYGYFSDFGNAGAGGPKPGALLLPDNAGVVARGKQVYGEYCAACHGRNLEGQKNWRERDAAGFLPAPPHDESGHTWHHTDDVLFGITKFGIAKFAGLDDYKSNMQPFRDILSDDQIIAALSYIKSRWPREIRDRHDQMNAARAEEARK